MSAPKYIFRAIPLWIIPVVLGAGSFFCILSPTPLIFNNIGWLAGGGDPTQHYLGWAFFRYGPWTMPFGLNPNFGLELSSSVVYSDSIPLLAFLFKPFSSWLPEPFQYFGLWLLCCFVLQAIGAWLLSSLLTADRIVRLLVTSYFVFMPAWLWRFVVTNSLAAHFLLLFGLYLVFAKQKKFKNWLWLVLLGLAATIHFYLLAMMLILWGAALLECDKVISLHFIKTRLIAILTTVVTLLFLFWQCGYFAVQSQAAVSGSYGIGHLNLLGLVDSNGWSYILPNVKETPDSYNSFDKALSYFEGYSYLGLGLLFCLGFALWGLQFHKVSVKELISRFPYLFIALFCLTVFAISNNIGVGPWNITLPLPESVRSTASILRASARMFWPVYYVFTLFILYCIIRSYPRKLAIGILSVGLLIQIVDTSAGWLPLRQRLVQSKATEWATSLTDPFWADAGKQYQKVLRVEASNHNHNWETFAYFAIRNHLSTNSIFLSRIDDQKLDYLNNKLNQQIQKGKYDLDALYILENDKVIPALKSLNKDKDLFARLNGFNVLAPGWLDCVNCPTVSQEKWIASQIPTYRIGEPIILSRSGKNILPFVLVAGWAYPESWGTWSDGRSAKLALAIPLGNPQTLTLDMRAFVQPQYPSQMIEIWINQQLYTKRALTEDQFNQIVIPISEAHLKQQYLNIDFNFLNPIRPKDIGLGDDDRQLSIGLQTAIFR